MVLSWCNLHSQSHIQKRQGSLKACFNGISLRVGLRFGFFYQHIHCFSCPLPTKFSKVLSLSHAVCFSHFSVALYLLSCLDRSLSLWGRDGRWKGFNPGAPSGGCSMLSGLRVRHCCWETKKRSKPLPHLLLFKLYSLCALIAVAFLLISCVISFSAY